PARGSLGSLANRAQDKNVSVRRTLRTVRRAEWVLSSAQTTTVATAHVPDLRRSLVRCIHCKWRRSGQPPDTGSGCRRLTLQRRRRPFTTGRAGSLARRNLERQLRRAPAPDPERRRCDRRLPGALRSAYHPGDGRAWRRRLATLQLSR